MTHRVHTSLALLLCALFGASAAWAECSPQMIGEFWAEEDFKIAGIDVSVAECPSWYSGFRVGASYYGNDGYTYQGVTAAGRLQFGSRVSPYVGYGVLLGLGEKDVSAEFDGEDNNGNGITDEPGEMETEQDFSVFAFPEVGIGVSFKTYGVAVSARQYYGKEFSGDVIYSFGISKMMGR